MNRRMIWFLLSATALVEAALLLFPTLVAALYGESVAPFLWTVLILVLLGLPGVLVQQTDRRISAREGFVVVTLAWVLMGLCGALPFVFSGAIPRYLDAVFETVSGLTTTGASILSGVETLPRGILFWRSFTHWIGGMGVLVFLLAILPGADGRSIYLLRAEVPGPTKGKLVPRMRHTALILYGIYVALTVCLIVALLLCGQPLFDAVVNAFGTAGTGGFSVRDASIGGYGSPAVEWVIAVFMMLFGVNFTLYYFLLIGRAREVWKSEEFRVYLGIIVLSVGAIAIDLSGRFATFGECLRTVYFQVMTVMSTAGFSTADFNLWTPFSKGILLLLMLVGACAGSTAGGLKVSRVMILVRNGTREIRHALNPRSVNEVRLEGAALPEETVRSASGYFLLYVATFLVSALLVATGGEDFETNVTAVIACLNNIGPGFGKVGPTGNFGGFSVLPKIVLILDMLLGRLEIFPLLVTLTPSKRPFPARSVKE